MIDAGAAAPHGPESAASTDGARSADAAAGPSVDGSPPRLSPRSAGLPDTMDVGVYYGPGDVRVERRPVPDFGRDEILVETLASGLCASEALDWYSKRAGGKVLGHEPVGRVAALGDRVEGLEIGDRIFVNHHVGRMSSHWAVRGRYTKDPYFKATRLHPGSMAEYFRVGAAHLRADVHVLDDAIPDAVATTIEPWSCVLGGLKQCMIQPGDTVAVVGAGFMGLGFVHMAPLFGAGTVVALDFSDWRLAKAEELGASATANPAAGDPAAAIRAINRGLLADVVVLTAPSAAAFASARALVEPGGTLHVGAPGPPGSQFVLDGAEAFLQRGDHQLEVLRRPPGHVPVHSPPRVGPGRPPRRDNPRAAARAAVGGLRDAHEGRGLPQDRHEAQRPGRRRRRRFRARKRDRPAGPCPSGRTD